MRHGDSRSLPVSALVKMGSSMAGIVLQSVPIPQRLPGGRVRPQMLEQLVGSGNDVLDPGRVDQHRGVRKQPGGLFQLGKRRAGHDALLQDWRCFRLDHGAEALARSLRHQQGLAYSQRE